MISKIVRIGQYLIEIQLFENLKKFASKITRHEMQIVLLIFSATFLQCYFMHKTLRKTEAQLSNACLPYVKWSETRLSCKQHACKHQH